MAAKLDNLEGVYDRLKDNVSRAIKENLEQIVKTARSIKFYTTRSGLLDRAYVFEMASPFEGAVYLDKQISNAPYAYAIHEGRRDWPRYRPDKFLDRSAEINKNKIENDLKKAVKDSI